MTTEQLQSKITEFKLSAVLLSAALGTHPTTFHEKLKNKRGNRFKDSELLKLKEFINDMGEVLLKV